MTISELFTRTYREHWSQPRYQASGWNKKAKGYYERRIKGPFGGLSLTSVTPRGIRMWHKNIDKPIEANRALEVLSRLFTHAIEHELFDKNPCIGIRAFPERKRSRYAIPEEIRRLDELLKRHQARSPRDCVFVYTLLFTGARPSTLARAKRGELRGSTLTLPGKTTEDTGVLDVVELPARILEMLNTLPQRADGLLLGDPIPNEFWNKIRAEGGFPDLWLRDLRRTFASIALSSGIELSVVGELLNHKSHQTTMRYAKLLPDARIRAVSTVSAGISEIIG